MELNKYTDYLDSIRAARNNYIYKYGDYPTHIVMSTYLFSVLEHLGHEIHFYQDSYCTIMGMKIDRVGDAGLWFYVGSRIHLK